MGSSHSSEKMHCNRYLKGKGPPSLVEQANEEARGLYRERKGYQPEGQMTWVILHRDLAGFPKANTVQINYMFPDGIQTLWLSARTPPCSLSDLAEELSQASERDVLEAPHPKEKHPHPGQPYAGMQLCAYLPDNREGRKVLDQLHKAFNQQVLFTVTTTKGGEDIVTTTAIPLKTQPDGGSRVDGYPDSEYLKTVRKLLRNKGIE